jgi:YD repeat-containing protein
MQNPSKVPLKSARMFVVCALATMWALPHSARAQVLGPPAAPSAAGIATLPPPSIDADKALGQLGLTPRGQVYTRKRHHEITATTNDGRTVLVAFDWAGRIKSVTDANHRKGGFAAAAPPAQAQLSEGLRAAGFDPLGIVHVKRDHVVMRARNRQGELLELHVDFGGTIYKQVWLR